MAHDLYRSALRARISKLPDLPPWDTRATQEEDVDMSTSTGMGAGEKGEREGDVDEEMDDEAGIGDLPNLSNALPRLTHRSRTPVDYTPLSAEGYFDQSLSLLLPSRELDVRLYYTPALIGPEGGNGALVVAHHGAGSGALSFASFAREVGVQSKGECGVLAADCRGHGKTRSTSSSEEGDLLLSQPDLSKDLLTLLTTLFPSPSQAPSLVLLGHSMGASVVLGVLDELLEKGYQVTGIGVLDVVEGTALEALPHMRSLLLTRPPGFPSLEAAIQWHVKNNTLRNVQSARISVPPLFVPGQNNQGWVWRAPLEKTEPFWEGWFTNLSSRFLTARTARLLLLAGTERLDKPLMIGQMQGKFQLVVIPGVGHHLQEDDPARTAGVVLEFWSRNERVFAGVKKVGER
ncbi:protein phosphatase methylesterase [Dacryopinax primogenitus]|uniref:Protein phosphatase methylesterase 1 n=1 Tax=Dacryopinax primogenitus (strain DJM 731) TaxID=1858805 RepID=M5FQ09_DACPD|nr:protein phosphatase methylesterase [Dacryopinax primogenitus]EJT97458.1 protein phosphatase methylesterase [Dacryopinax primogenitus]